MKRIAAFAALSLLAGCAFQTDDEPDFHGVEEEPVATVQHALTSVESAVTWQLFYQQRERAERANRGSNEL